jgi:hypothetical protein
MSRNAVFFHNNSSSQLLPREQPVAQQVTLPQRGSSYRFASDSNDLVERVERFLDFCACPLIVGRSCSRHAFAVHVARVIDVVSSGQSLSEVIISGDVTRIPRYYFSKLQHSIGWSVFLLQLERQRITRERIVRVCGDEFFKCFSSTLHSSLAANVERAQRRKTVPSLCSSTDYQSSRGHPQTSARVLTLRLTRHHNTVRAGPRRWEYPSHSPFSDSVTGRGDASVVSTCDFPAAAAAAAAAIARSPRVSRSRIRAALPRSLRR